MKKKCTGKIEQMSRSELESLLFDIALQFYRDKKIPLGTLLASAFKAYKIPKDELKEFIKELMENQYDIDI